MLLTDTVGFVRNLPHGLVEAFKGTLEVAARADYLVHVVDASAPDPTGQIAAVRAVLAEIDAAVGARAARVQQVRPRAARRPSSWSFDHPGSVAISAVTGEGIDEFLAVARRPAAGADVASSSSRSRTSAATCSPRCIARARWSRPPRATTGSSSRPRLSDASLGRLADFVTAGRQGAPRSSIASRMANLTGFVPPPYPYERIDRFKPLGERFEGGLVDLSIGTPCDPPPPAVIAALAGSDSERGYPPSIGTVALREAVSAWIDRRFGVDVPARPRRRLRRHQGVRRARCRSGSSCAAPTATRSCIRRSSYPTYEMGAILAGCRPVAGAAHADRAARPRRHRSRRRRRGRWRCGSTAPATRPARSTISRAAAAWGRAHGVPVFSDECYVEFTWAGAARTILEHGLDGVVAVHSLSKRSNLAGVRVGFYAGDPDLVEYLQRGAQARRHDGARARPRPPAWPRSTTTPTSRVQRDRYRSRLERMASVLAQWSGIDVPLPDGGFYLWFHVGDAWAFTERLVARIGRAAQPRRLLRRRRVPSTSASPWYNLTTASISSPAASGSRI